MNKNASPAPWYKHRWPWLLMAGPAVVIVAGAVTVWLAIRTADGLVDDDYYKQGLAVNQRIHRDQAATDQHLQAQLAVGEDGRQLRVIVRAAADWAAPDALILYLAHPTRAGQDERIELVHAGSGLYQGTSAAPLAGRWQVTLSDRAETWRLTGRWAIDAAERTLTLAPR